MSLPFEIGQMSLPFEIGQMSLPFEIGQMSLPFDLLLRISETNFKAHQLMAISIPDIGVYSLNERRQARLKDKWTIEKEFIKSEKHWRRGSKTKAHILPSGTRHGKFTSWNRKGIMVERGCFKNGKLVGKCEKWWDKNGNKLVEHEYASSGSEEVQKWIGYDIDGNIQGECFYDENGEEHYYINDRAEWDWGDYWNEGEVLRF